MNHTVQRDAILKELRMSHDHPTADRLYEVLRKKLPQISLGTVYRNLEQMAKMGTIRCRAIRNALTATSHTTFISAVPDVI